ncbi:MAG: hypothetical protein ABR910_15855 [Acidobacteriaceae bacterium]|jgi:hypothetical protein
MTDLQTAGQKAHRASAIILITIAGACLLISVIGIIVPSFSVTLLFAIIAMIVANSAFKHFETAAIPGLPTVGHQDSRFVIPLKDAGEAIIFLEIYFETVFEPPYALDRIKAKIQRRLREGFLDRNSLPANPFPFIDGLFPPPMINALKKELRLDELSIQTIDAEHSHQPKPVDHWK